MKILCFTKHYYPSIGGVEISSRIFARELISLGHIVTIVTATSLPEFTQELDEGYLVTRTNSFANLRAIARKHDIVIIRGGISVPIAVAAILARCSLVIVHEVGTLYEIGPKKFSTARLWVSTKERMKLFIYPFISFHLGVSEAILKQKTLCSYTSRDCLYNPVPAELWTAAPLDFDSRCIDFAFIGRIIKSKGIFTFLKAVERLSYTRKIRVVVAGTGDTERMVREYCQKKKLPIELVGPKSGQELREIYRTAKAVIVPSITNEGMGMTIAEAFANGTPVCASNQPAFREVAANAGLFHERGNDEELAASMKKLLEDRVQWKELSDSAIQMRERYSMTRYQRNLALICAKIEKTVKRPPKHRE